ncbi:MAG: hypothetical protein JWN78_2289 [Bacteroidota bacterium]|nr:hypothetical protein [Bacteroidota bacterium]
MQLFKFYFLLCFTLLFICSCQTVKPYQRVYLNDPEMQMGKNNAERYEEHVQDIREGATPPGGATKSGGCGCN